MYPLRSLYVPLRRGPFRPMVPPENMIGGSFAPMGVPHGMVIPQTMGGVVGVLIPEGPPWYCGGVMWDLASTIPHKHTHMLTRVSVFHFHCSFSFSTSFYLEQTVN